MLKIKRPKRYKIEIWEEDGKWYENYEEFFADTKENVEAIDKTMAFIEMTLTNTGFKSVKCKK